MINFLDVDQSLYPWHNLHSVRVNVSVIALLRQAYKDDRLEGFHNDCRRRIIFLRQQLYPGCNSIAHALLVSSLVLQRGSRWRGHSYVLQIDCSTRRFTYPRTNPGQLKMRMLTIHQALSILLGSQLYGIRIRNRCQLDISM